MAKRHMLYVWSDIVMARNRSVRYPSYVVPSGLFTAPCPSRSSMRSHPLPSRGGVRGGVCNISNIQSAKSVGEEVSAKSGLQRSGSEGVAARNITDITDPTPAPPRKGRVQEGMAAHKSFLQRVNCYIIGAPDKPCGEGRMC